MDNLEEEFQVKRHEVFKHQEMGKSNEQQVKECLRADKKGEVGWTGGKKILWYQPKRELWSHLQKLFPIFPFSYYQQVLMEKKYKLFNWERVK